MIGSDVPPPGEKKAPTLESVNLRSVMTTKQSVIETGKQTAKLLIEKFGKPSKDKKPLEGEPEKNFDVNKIKFVSMDDQTIGSMYFEGGFRMRLVHREGPALEDNGADQAQYCLKDDKAEERFNYLADPLYDLAELIDEDLDKKDDNDTLELVGKTKTVREFKEYREDLRLRYLTSRQVEQQLKDEKLLLPALPETDGTIVEFSDNGCHISAGKPRSLPKNLDQDKLNLLVKAAATENNVTMQECFAYVQKNWPSD